MERKQIVITKTPESLTRQIDNIAKYQDKKTVNFLRPLIRDIIKDFPEELQQKTETSTKDVKIQSLPKDTLEKLENICHNFFNVLIITKFKQCHYIRKNY